MTTPHRQAPVEAARGNHFAVVLVDLQNDFCHPDGVFSRAGFRLGRWRELVNDVNALIRAARAGGHLLVWTKMVWDDDEQMGLLPSRSPFLAHEGLRRGTWGVELLDDLAVDQSDLVVEKTRFSSFYRTGLEAALRDNAIDHLAVAGVRTDFCVESTVRDAFFRDMQVFLPAETVAGYVPDLHEHSLRLMNTVFARIVTLEEAVGLLRVPPESA